jgi:hypothetical protein
VLSSTSAGNGGRPAPVVFLIVARTSHPLLVMVVGAGR